LDWPGTKGKQHHWIGRSIGAEIDFAVAGAAGPADKGPVVRVFTTRADTLPGVTYVVLAPEHPLVAALVGPEERASVGAYVEAAKRKSDLDRAEAKTKTGVPLGASVVNPVSGAKIPLWVADYVIATYGTGAVMAVPAHDERDHAFAITHGLPIAQVIEPAPGSPPIDVKTAAFTGEGVARYGRIAADVPDGTPSEEARARITRWIASQGRGGEKVTYRLRDWVFSRQRYWGEPIPIYFPVYASTAKDALAFDPRTRDGVMHIDYGDPRAVTESDLPVLLPELDDFKPSGDAVGPLGRARDWRFFQRGGQWFARETNTMPQWAGSCWYYLRFADPHNKSQAWSAQADQDWMPVDLYVGGGEHAVLHLLYARFWHKVLFDLGLAKDSEPFV
ncbi:MAG: leucine--tRNA ligase, partial [Polyangiaceae bacterium]